MGVLHRLLWLVAQRPALARTASSAHWDSYVCPKSKLGGYNKLSKGTQISDSSLGRFTYVVSAKITRASVGAFCSIGPNVVIGGLGAHPSGWISTHPAFYSTRMQAGAAFVSVDRFEELKRNQVGSDVWIGANCLILDGVKIGDGAIVAAGAVVTKDVPPYAVVGGVPAKVLKYRFSEEVIESLLSWKWWNLTERELTELADDFCSASVWTACDISNMKTKLEKAAVKNGN